MVKVKSQSIIKFHRMLFWKRSIKVNSRKAQLRELKSLMNIMRVVRDNSSQKTQDWQIKEVIFIREEVLVWTEIVLMRTTGLRISLAERSQMKISAPVASLRWSKHTRDNGRLQIHKKKYKSLIFKLIIIMLHRLMDLKGDLISLNQAILTLAHSEMSLLNRHNRHLKSR